MGVSRQREIPSEGSEPVSALDSKFYELGELSRSGNRRSALGRNRRSEDFELHLERLKSRGLGRTRR